MNPQDLLIYGAYWAFNNHKHYCANFRFGDRYFFFGDTY